MINSFISKHYEAPCVLLKHNNFEFRENFMLDRFKTVLSFNDYTFFFFLLKPKNNTPEYRGR